MDARVDGALRAQGADVAAGAAEAAGSAGEASGVGGARLLEAIGRHVASTPDAVALVASGRELTYGRLWAAACRVSAQVADGCVPGSVVVLVAAPSTEMVACWLGLRLAGCIVAFADAKSTVDDLASLCEQVEARLVIGARGEVPGMEGRCVSPAGLVGAAGAPGSGGDVSAGLVDPAHVAAADPLAAAELIFTTGTTGRPKGATLSARAVDAIAANTARGLALTEADRVLIPLPLSHSYALRVLRATLRSGARAILQAGLAFARTTERNIVEGGCTGAALVPASLETLRAQMGDERLFDVLGHLRYVEFGAGALSAAQRDELVARLPDTRVCNTWGSSETGGCLFLDLSAERDDADAFASSGRPAPGVEVGFVGEGGAAVAGDRAHPGRLRLRGPMCMSGYWGRPDLSAEALAGGWLLTGDLAWLDGHGFVHLLGRADDLINVGGEKVAPSEVEDVASRVAGVLECACLGIDDPKGLYGQVPALIVVERPGAQVDVGSLKAELAQVLARYKVPQEVRVTHERLPRNRREKLDRAAIARMWDGLAGGDGAQGHAEGGKDVAAAGDALLRLMLTRRSVRDFDRRPVPAELVDRIVEAAYHAPTGHNLQTWRFTVLEDAATIARLKEATLAAAASAGVATYGFKEPAVVVLVSNDVRNHDGCQDASAAAENLLLAAHALGLGGTWFNGLATLREVEPVAGLLDELGLPRRHVVWCAALLGWPQAIPAAPKRKPTVVRYVDR